jgi:hypothetical protein
MRISTLALSLSAAALLTACGSGQTAGTQQRNAAATTTPTPAASAASNADLGVVSSHGGGSGANAGAGGANANAASDRALVDTKKLDERIKEASAKAKQSGASAADKRAAADAYLERGNVYYSAGQPRLYKYALADFREVLRYDSANDEAKEKIEQIESIYRGMGRPVPTVSADGN